MFFLNYRNETLDFKVDLAVPLGDDSKLMIEIDPELSWARTHSISSWVVTNNKPSPKLAVRIAPDGISLIAGFGASIPLLEIEHCGISLAELSLQAELSTEIGVAPFRGFTTTTFKAKFALGFEEGFAGLLDSGGLEWQFPEIRRSTNEPPVTRVQGPGP